VKTYNYSIAGVLRGCSIKVMMVKYFYCRQILSFIRKVKRNKTKEILNNACKEVTKKDVKIEVVLKEVK